MEPSILTSTKKILGIASDYTAFDLDIATHINNAFSTLTQLGVGDPGGFFIDVEGKENWSDFLDDDDPSQSAVKSYVYLKVRMLFDPPTTSFLLQALQQQLEQMEWRLNVTREGDTWVDPDPPVPPSEYWPYYPTWGDVVYG